MLKSFSTMIAGTVAAGPPATLARLNDGVAGVSFGLLLSELRLLLLIVLIWALVVTSPISYHSPPLVSGMSIPSRFSDAAELLMIVTLALFGAMIVPVPPNSFACTSTSPASA